MTHNICIILVVSLEAALAERRAAAENPEEIELDMDEEEEPKQNASIRNTLYHIILSIYYNIVYSIISITVIHSMDMDEGEEPGAARRDRQTKAIITCKF